MPREVAPNKEFPLPEPALDCSNVPAGVYIMRSTSQSCCELKDARGAHFSVISNGEMKIERQEEIPGEGKTVAEEEKNARRSGIGESYLTPFFTFRVIGIYRKNCDNKPRGLFLVKGPFRKNFSLGALYLGGGYTWANI